MAFNVLIVDDSSSMRKVIKRTIEISGFDVGQIFEAANGREALEVLESEWADIILTDIHMPEMDGLSFLKTLNKKEVVSATPVVVVTTEGREDRVEEYLALGAKACVRKPFKPEEIKGTLLNVLGMEASALDDSEALDGCDF